MQFRVLNRMGWTGSSKTFLFVFTLELLLKTGLTHFFLLLACKGEKKRKMQYFEISR
jgi:hypothetical protein